MSRPVWFSGGGIGRIVGEYMENTEAYMDTVPFAERWLVPAAFMVFPYRQYTQMARVCLASGLE